ncbi:MAG: TonB-dependent receptor [Muribaculaceae bacterium]|nr:TonB-dependent receptor [Muribaculaceae bacterium]
MRILTVILILLAATAASAAEPRTITGTVTGDEGKPLAGVSVKLYRGAKLRTFSRTNSAGAYSVRIPDTDSLRLVFERMSYRREERLVPPASTLDVEMVPEATDIREVVISAPSVKLRGDTLSFNLAAFIGKGDVSLEDALKKIPGITVEGSGAIKYLGKDISNFYVEGLEMLGGRYALATRNLPAEYVSSVEVLNNHKDRKMDAGKHSDEVAVNVRLKSTARIRPVGTYEGALGYGSGHILYRIAGTAMIFKPGLQSLVSVKAGNVERFSNSDITVHNAAGGRSSSAAASVLPPVSSGSAPLSAARYENARDRLVSVNTLLKTSPDANLKANINYAYSHNDFAYSSLTEYFTGGESLLVEERNAPASSSHKPSLDVDYTLNASNRYVTNRFKVSGEVARQRVEAMNSGVAMAQTRRLRMFDIYDDFRYSTRVGNREWDFSTGVSLNNTPVTHLNIGGRAGEAEFTASQSVKSTTFAASQSAYTSWHRTRSVFYLSLGAKYEYDDVFTGLERPEDEYSNRIYSHKGNISVASRYEYNLPGNRLNLRLALPLNMIILRARNPLSGGKMSVTRPTFTPDVYAFIKLDGMSEFNASANYSNTVGDFLDLLDNPVQTSYRSLTARSGLIAKTRGWSANLGYKYERPFDFWLVRANAAWSTSRRNIVNSQYVSAGETFSTFILSPNTTDIATLSAVLSKRFTAINTKLDLNATYAWSRRELVQQDIAVRYYGNTLSAYLRANLRPWKWMEFEWMPRVGKSISRYLASKSSYVDFSEQFKLSFYPLEVVTLKAGVEHVRKQISAGQYKNMALVDFTAAWRYKKWRYNLSLSNLLNRHSYSYTVFNGVDTWYYDYALRGRSIVAGVSYTL